MSLGIQKTAEIPRGFLEWDARLKSNHDRFAWASEKFVATEIFNPGAVGKEQSRRDTRRHAVLGIGPGDQTAQGWESGKSLNVQALLFMKTSMIPEENQRT